MEYRYLIRGITLEIDAGKDEAVVSAKLELRTSKDPPYKTGFTEVSPVKPNLDTEETVQFCTWGDDGGRNLGD
jgi:hypothetical protein